MREPGKHDPERQTPRDRNQRGKADQLVRKRIDTREELGKRAHQAEDPRGGPDQREAPAREQ
jgi:hypothetical protein